MGFFGDLLGFSPEARQINGYFNGQRSNYDAMRLCIRDMIAVPAKQGTLKQDTIIKVRDELSITTSCGDLVMRDLFQVALARIQSSHRDVTLVRPVSAGFTGPAVTAESPGVSPHKTSDQLRFSLLTNDKWGWAWVSLYDDGTRMRPNIEMIDQMGGWNLTVQG